jgi:beta-phosphoglucomutase-like phosphatase (HAD superfamily)
MNKKIDTVIFDFDGVLFDTEEINYNANELTFQQHGLSFSKQEYARLWVEEGLDMEDIISRYNIERTPN